MERTLQDPEIDVYLTLGPDRLPEYGDRVVAVVLGDEVGRIPRYVGRVRAVFKDYGVRPALAGGPLRDPSLTGVLELAQYTIRWLRWLPDGAGARRPAREPTIARAAHPSAGCRHPVGTFNQLDLPIIPIEERATDVCFAGSLEHETSLRHRWGSPTAHARRQMIGAVERLRRNRPGPAR
jgi:hypothetical protein